MQRAHACGVGLSIQHEAPLLLLCERPELLVPLLGLEIGPGATVSLGNAEFTQAVPLERRADAVVTIEENGRLTSAFVVEVQLARDDEKHFTWPLYAASLHARVRCPTTLVVFALDPQVAEWARQPIATLQPSRPFAPTVLGPGEIPRITDEARALRMPELAILSALVHGAGPQGEEVIRHAVAAAAQLDDERASQYNDLLWSALGDVARAALEALMTLGDHWYKSEFAKKVSADALARGIAEGRSEGLAEGRIEEARRILLALMGTRELGPSESGRSRIHACSEPEILERWILCAASVTNEDDVFVET